MSDLDRLLTPQEVCDLIPGMTPKALAQRRFRGTSPRFVKLGHKVYFRASAVTEWLDAHEQEITGRKASA